MPSCLAQPRRRRSDRVREKLWNGYRITAAVAVGGLVVVHLLSFIAK